jgi:hypothetical protein
VERSRRWSTAAATVGVLVTTLGGCSMGSSSAPDAVDPRLVDALDRATSAVGTASLAADLLEEDRVTATVADTALLDALRVVGDADDALTTLVPPDAEAAADRGDALDAVGDAADAVVDARAWVNGIAGDHAGVSARLEQAAGTLDALAARLGGSS